MILTQILLIINRFKELVSKLMNAGDDESNKDEEPSLLLLVLLSKSYKSLVQSILVGKSALGVDDVVR